MVEATEQPGDHGDPGTGDAGEQREGLEQADDTGFPVGEPVKAAMLGDDQVAVRRRRVVGHRVVGRGHGLSVDGDRNGRDVLDQAGSCLAAAAQPFSGEEDDAVEGEKQRGCERFREQGPEGVFQCQAGESDGDRGDDDQPGQPLLRRGDDACVQRVGQGAEDAGPVGSEKDEERDGGRDVQCDDERQVGRLFAAGGRRFGDEVLPASADHRGYQHGMPEAGYRKQFGYALQQPGDNRLDVGEVAHGSSRLCSMSVKSRAVCLVSALMDRGGRPVAAGLRDGGVGQAACGPVHVPDVQEENGDETAGGDDAGCRGEECGPDMGEVGGVDPSGLEVEPGEECADTDEDDDEQHGSQRPHRVPVVWPPHPPTPGRAVGGSGCGRAVSPAGTPGRLGLDTVVIGAHTVPSSLVCWTWRSRYRQHGTTKLSYATTRRRGRDDGGCMGDRVESRRARRARGALESEVLAALWAGDGPVTPAAIQQSLGDDLAYTTVTTILARLEEKGLAERVPTGRGYAWRAVAAQEELAARQMKALLKRGETPTAVLQRFVEQLSPVEGAVLRSLLAGQTPPDAGPSSSDRSDGARGGD